MFSLFGNKLIRNRERGIGKLTFLVFGFLAGALVYCAYHIIPFYYYYYELINQMEAVIRVAGVEPDREIRKKLMYHIKKMGIPVDESELRIEREGKKMKIRLPYKEVFYITWRDKTYDLHVFEFDAKAEGEY